METTGKQGSAIANASLKFHVCVLVTRSVRYPATSRLTDKGMQIVEG